MEQPVSLVLRHGSRKGTSVCIASSAQCWLAGACQFHSARRPDQAQRRSGNVVRISQRKKVYRTNAPYRILPERRRIRDLIRPATDFTLYDPSSRWRKPTCRPDQAQRRSGNVVRIPLQKVDHTNAPYRALPELRRIRDLIRPTTDFTPFDRVEYKELQGAHNDQINQLEKSAIS